MGYCYLITRGIRLAPVAFWAMNAVSSLADTFEDTYRVLHVDDDRDFSDLTSIYLEREDDRFAVETATSASEGLERLADRWFDCIISDYDMPGGSGIEFLETVRESEPDLPFILFTGKGTEEVASDAISAGVTDYLQKEGGTGQYTVLSNLASNAVEHHRSVRMVEQRDQRLQDIVERVTDALVEVDSDWQFTFVNRQAEGLYEMDQEYLLGRDFWEVFTEAQNTRFEEEYRGVMDTREPTSFIEYFSQLNGWFDIEAYPKDDGGIAFYFVEVTNQHERERELERTNDLLGTLIETLPVGVLAENESREVLAVNERMLELFEISERPDSVIGADCTKLVEEVSELFVDPSAFVEGVDSAIESGDSVEDQEMRLKDNRYFGWSYEPIEVSGGPGHLWVCCDITGQKE